VSPGSRQPGEVAASTLLRAATVARIPYLNAEPFYAHWSALPGTTVDRVPRRLGEEAERGAVDAGLMAVVDALRLADTFERLGPFGVACDGAVESVLLLHGGSLDALAGGRIWLTGESSTSVRLCRLLLERHLGLAGLRYERRDFDAAALPGASPPEGEAWLVIGDAALVARRDRPKARMLDLGAAWKAWTGRPFVYAVWAVRRALPEELKRGLAQFLETSLSDGLAQLDAIAAAYAERTAGRMGTAADLRRYLERFTYRLGPAEEAGLTLFAERARENAT